MRKKGDGFSKFHSSIKLVTRLKETQSNNCLSLWECKNHKYGYFINSGLTPITDRLFNVLINEEILI